MDPAAPGEIITFYSYKGGTGRSMALANLACLLAQRTVRRGDRGVLVVDWDLEAPGLHRFFRSLFKRTLGDSLNYEESFDSRPGLLDLISEFQSKVADLPNPEKEPDESAENFLSSSVSLDKFILKSDLEGLHFLKAGRFDEKYAEKVNTFAWEDFYRRAPWFFPWFLNLLAQRYQYVLIDSRTGVTDTSGICTMLVPDKLVVVFTPNLQSLEGVLGLVKRATDYRRHSDDLRPLIIIPLPSRIEPARPVLRDQWRYDRSIGYQSRFEQIFKGIYDLPECDLKAYFDDVPIYQVPDYAYGEEIAVLVERGGDKLSLSRSYDTVLGWLEGSRHPWEHLTESAPPSAADEALTRAYLTLPKLSPAEEAKCRRVIGRLVLLGVDASTDSRIRLQLSDLDPELQDTVQSLRESGIVIVSEAEASRNAELAHDILIREPPIRNWLEEDREFLHWRQALEVGARDWERASRDKGLLLQGTALAEGKSWLANRADDFTHLEKSFIQKSALSHQQATQRFRRGWWAVVAIAGLFLAATVAVVTWLALRKDPVTQLTDLGWKVHKTDKAMELEFAGVPPQQSLKELKRISLPLSVHLGGIDSSIFQWGVLKNLTALSLSRTDVSDVSPLEGLTNLTALDLAYTKVSDVSPLERLTNLATLNLAYTKVSDVSPLKQLTNLTTLSLTGSEVSDVSPLKDLTDLTTLNLAYTKVSDVSPLKQLANLTALNLTGSDVSDVSPLKDLKKLEIIRGPSPAPARSPSGSFKRHLKAASQY